MKGLAALGWSAERAAQFGALELKGCVPGRVAVEHKTKYDVLTEAGEVVCVLAGRLRHEASSRLAWPAVGDWVAVQPPGGDGDGTIQSVLPRASAFMRQVAGSRTDAQIVAANIDVVFQVSALTDEFNPRRLERYLALAWESGATPVVLLSKADLCGDPAPLVAEAERVAGGVPVIVVSTRTGQGMDAVAALLGPGRTGALLGSSGVGKSTLINALVGHERQATAEVRRRDGKGRHTTTWRELVLLPGGGLLIDTPGMRELQLSEAGDGMADAFADVESLAAQCDFRDCTHGPEPGCAVRAAIAAGSLDAARLGNYLKLQGELAHLERREDRAAAAERKRTDKVADRALQKRLREKRGRS